VAAATEETDRINLKDLYGATTLINEAPAESLADATAVDGIMAFFARITDKGFDRCWVGALADAVWKDKEAKRSNYVQFVRAMNAVRDRYRAMM